jgi:hypothetical protein
MDAEEHGKPWRERLATNKVGDEPFREKTSFGGTGIGKSWPMYYQSAHTGQGRAVVCQPRNRRMADAARSGDVAESFAHRVAGFFNLKRAQLELRGDSHRAMARLRPKNGRETKARRTPGDHPRISRFDFVRYDAPPKEKCR